MKQAHFKRRFINLRHLSVLPTRLRLRVLMQLANETASLASLRQAVRKYLTVRQDERRRSNKMQDATTRIELHSLHSSGDVPPINSEPTGPPGNEPTGHDEPTGALKDGPQVAGAQPPLPL